MYVIMKLSLLSRAAQVLLLTRIKQKKALRKYIGRYLHLQSTTDHQISLRGRHKAQLSRVAMCKG